MAKQYITPRLTDKKIVRLFAELAPSLSIENATLSIHSDIGENTNEGSEPETINLSDTKDLERFTDSNVNAKFTLSVPPFNNSSITLSRALVRDEITIRFPKRNNSQLSRNHAAELISKTQKFFPPFDDVSHMTDVLGSEVSTFYQKREESLMRLEELSQNVIIQNEEYRRRTDEELNANRKELQAGIDTKRSELQDEYETKYSNLKKDHEAKLDAIRAKEKQLSEKEQQLDNSSNRDARRKIHKSIKSLTAERNSSFSLTKDTVRKRIIIHAVFGVLISLMLILIIRALLRGNSDFENHAPGLVKSLYPYRVALSTFALIAMGLYYIRWTDIWFKRHADEEFSLKRFELDIDRASWVVEMALEWKKDTEDDLPLELLDRLTTNLFIPADKASSAKHPSEDLLSAILGASSEADINLPMAKVKFNRSGTSKLKKTIEKQ